MIVSHEPIPVERFNLWFQLFCSTGCRFTQDPAQYGSEVRVYYEVFDIAEYNDFYREYMRLTKPIKETKRGLLRKLLKRLTNRG